MKQTSSTEAAAVRDPVELERALGRLVETRRSRAEAIGSELDEVDRLLVARTADPATASPEELAESGEHLLCRLDDMRDSDDQAWEEASKAVDPYVV